MFGELPNLPDPSKEIFQSHLKVQPTRQASTLKDRFNRFFQQFSGLFANRKEEEKEPLLMGRIHELESSGREVLNSLLTLKATVSQEMEPMLGSAASSLIDPIIREIKRLLSQLETKQNPAQQVKAYNRYADYVEKGKIWISVLSNGTEKAEFQEFVKIQMIEEFHVRIERDLQLIQDYLDHGIARPEIDHPSKETLAEKIRMELAPFLENLNNLKESPLEVDLESFFKWRSDVDHSREKWIEEALQVVDLHLNPHRRPEHS